MVEAPSKIMLKTKERVAASLPEPDHFLLFVLHTDVKPGRKPSGYARLSSSEDGEDSNDRGTRVQTIAVKGNRAATTWFALCLAQPARLWLRCRILSFIKDHQEHFDKVTRHQGQ